MPGAAARRRLQRGPYRATNLTDGDEDTWFTANDLTMLDIVGSGAMFRFKLAEQGSHAPMKKEVNSVGVAVVLGGNPWGHTDASYDALKA